MNEIMTKAGTKLPLISLKGKSYLQVAHRLVWFREENPDWSIETDFVERSEKHSVCKATIRDSSGRIRATAHKREDAGHFADHNEKSETGSIGRALALCGYGTQFAEEFDEGARIVDAPMQTKVSVTDFVIPLGTHKGRGLSTLSESERLELWEKIKAADPNSFPVEMRALFRKMVTLVGESVGQRVIVK